MSVALATNISTLIREYIGFEKESSAHDCIVSDFFSKVAAIHHYVMDRELQVTKISEREEEPYFTTLTYSDGSQWVQLPNAEKMRFCGFLYLQDALKRTGSDKIIAAPNKMAIYSNQIIYLSQYCGEKRPNMFDNSAEFATLTQVGFEDTLGGCNMRKQGNTVYVFDTEPSSFDAQVHEEINAFAALHDTVYSTLETRLKK